LEVSRFVVVARKLLFNPMPDVRGVASRVTGKDRWDLVTMIDLQRRAVVVMYRALSQPVGASTLCLSVSGGKQVDNIFRW
jgi:hypothetical protein